MSDERKVEGKSYWDLNVQKQLKVVYKEHHTSL